MISESIVQTDLLIRIFGMRRSGNHAIVYWLLGHMDGSFFFNDVNIPFDAQYALRRLKHPMPFQYNLTVVNWENKPLDRGQYIKNMAFNRQKTIIVMRDPFNWLASYMEKRWRVNKQLLCQYMEHLNEFIGETNNFEEKLCVNYNRWFDSREYRESIAKETGFERLNDAYLDYIPHEGGGSSFDFMRYKGAAQNMDVLKRWMHFIDNTQYRQWLRWPGLLEKAKQVWPEACQGRLERKMFI